ncbi:MAG: preprotein translocase subunit YajC, partial [Pseudomonadota bacterium]
MKFHTILAADPPAKPAKPQGGDSLLGSPFFFFGIILLMMYFLLIRPQSKQRKEQAARIASMEKGDKVVSIGGLHGVVHHISEKT